MTIIDEPVAAPARVRREPRTYEPMGPHSFLLDAARVHLGDPGALDRLTRHQHEERVEGNAESRVAPNVTAGTGGEFAVPHWYPEFYAGGSRAGRVLADLIPNQIPLPPGVDHIDIPRMTTATLANTQVDGGFEASQDIVTVDASSQVVTISGESLVSQQLFDLTPRGFDTYAYPDLLRAYNRALELQLITGTGTNGQLLGLVNVTVPAANTVSGASIGVTSPTLLNGCWSAMGQCAGNVSNNRLFRPEVWLMHGRRYFAMVSNFDSQGRPIQSPASQPPRVAMFQAEDPNSTTVEPAVSQMMGLPVYTDDVIPAGTGTDNIYAVRPSDMYLFEGAPRLLTAVEATAGTLQVRLSFHRYAAAILNRYPFGLGVVANIPQPTNY